MRIKIVLSGLLGLRLSVCEASVWAALQNQTLGKPAGEDTVLLAVCLSLAVGVFLLGCWGVRKLWGVNAGGAGNMRVVGGVSLGLWEKVVLLQIGNKQLILGLTPGRIHTLQALEGDDGLINADKTVRTDPLTATVAMPVPADLSSAGVAAAPERSASGEAPARMPSPRDYEKLLGHVQGLADENPKLVAQTLKAWIRDE